MYVIAQDPPINLFDAVMAYRSKQMTSQVIDTNVGDHGAEPLSNEELGTHPAPDFTTPITTVEQGKAWIAALHAADMMFHFEDSPETILKGMSDEPLFTKAQAKAVRKRVAELYALDWVETGHECPIGYALEVMEPDTHKPTLDRLSEEFEAYTTVHHLPQDQDAVGLIHCELTEDQRRWVSTFIRRWEAVERMEVA